MNDYFFGVALSDETIRKRLMVYHFGLLKMTKLTSEIRDFVLEINKKYRVEGE